MTLTIDNGDGALPIDYSEVTISRLLFRSGQSEYAINGDQCRLLDIAELLSDTGLGREMHVIVGQGQIDEVLNAGPDIRRALIEEAAGVLKHRRRKEKAVRKLESMQANLTRLVDLTGELGRRLKPLGRQAEIARKAAVIQADLRDAKLRLLADDYATLAAELIQDETDEAATVQARAALEAALAEARDLEAELEQAEQQHAPRLAAAQEAFFALSSLAERLRAVQGLAAERHRHLSAPEPQRACRDPEELEQEAAELRAQEKDLTARLAATRQQLTTAVSGRTKAEGALAENERRLAADAKAAAQRAEQLARLRSQVESATSRANAAQEEAGRLAEALAQARARAEQAQVEYAALQDLVSGREAGRADLAAEHEQASAAVTAASAAVAALRKTERAASAERAGLQARAEALTEAVSKGADASGIAAGSRQHVHRRARSAGGAADHSGRRAGGHRGRARRRLRRYRRDRAGRRRRHPRHAQGPEGRPGRTDHRVTWRGHRAPTCRPWAGTAPFPARLTWSPRRRNSRARSRRCSVTSWCALT